MTDEIEKVLPELKDSAVGVDHIKAEVIEHAAMYISTLLTSIVNLSLKQRVFPKAIEKSSSFISLLKLFEKVFYIRIYDYLSEYNILFHQQYGFIHKYSTDVALLSILNLILKAWEDKKVALALVTDLSKVFDPLDYQILLSKLISCDMRDPTLHWLKDYLSD